MTFLDAGFEGSAACNRLAGSPGDDEDQGGAVYLERIASAHHTETEMLTKMRLLTRPAVVEAAMALHLATHEHVDLVQTTLPEVPEEGRNAALEQVWQARRSFLAVAKSEIGLEPDVSPVTHGTT